MAFLDSGVQPFRGRSAHAVATLDLDVGHEAARHDFDAAFVREAIRELKPLYARVERVISPLEWAGYAPYIKAIRDLKREKNAVILAHNYMTPEVFHGVARHPGRQPAACQEAAKTDADIIVQCGVHFMAETSKLMNPDKTVLIPDPEGGLFAGVLDHCVQTSRLLQRTASGRARRHLRQLLERDVKAECDICCTSANAVQVVESLGVDRVIFLPDAVSGAVCRDADEGGDHPLAGPLRGA